MNIEPTGILGSDISFGRAIVSSMPIVGILKEFSRKVLYSNRRLLIRDWKTICNIFTERLQDTNRLMIPFVTREKFSYIDAGTNSMQQSNEEVQALYNKHKRGRIICLVTWTVSTILTVTIAWFALAFFASLFYAPFSLLLAPVLMFPLAYQVRDFSVSLHMGRLLEQSKQQCALALSVRKM